MVINDCNPSICRRDVIGRILGFQHGGPGSIPVGSEILISIPGLGVSSVVSGGGPDILLTTDSGRPGIVYLCNVLIQNLCSPTGI